MTKEQIRNAMLEYKKKHGLTIAEHNNYIWALEHACKGFESESSDLES